MVDLGGNNSSKKHYSAKEMSHTLYVQFYGLKSSTILLHTLLIDLPSKFVVKLCCGPIVGASSSLLSIDTTARTT